jgi:ABC-2 type transport system ATP-binding protein
VESLRAGGTTIVLTTHYLEEAERLADRILVLRDGEVAATGTPRTLGGRDRAHARIVFALPGGLAPGDLPAELASRVRMAAGGRFALESERAAEDLHALAGWAVAQGVELSELEVSRPSLEDIYLGLTTPEGRVHA